MHPVAETGRGFAVIQDHTSDAMHQYRRRIANRL